MSVPTRDSRNKPLTSEVASLLSDLAQARKLAVNQQAVLLSDTPIADIIKNIYVPLVRDVGFWETVKRVRLIGNFNRLFLDEVGLRFIIGPADVNPGNNRVVLGDNSFSIDDPVRFKEHDVLPGGLVEGTTYFILAKPTTGSVTLSATVQGAELDITSNPTGMNVLRFALNPELNAMETAMEAVIDQVILDVPVTAVTFELRSQIFDKALASSSNGLADAILTAAQTATLRTKLLDLQNSIEAPA